MDDQNKNLILATVLSGLVILVWLVLFPPEPPQQIPSETETSQNAETGSTASVPATATTEQGTTASVGETEQAVADAPRIAIDTPRLRGSISLIGGRIDELFLKDYHVEVDP